MRNIFRLALNAAIRACHGRSYGTRQVINYNILAGSTPRPCSLRSVAVDVCDSSVVRQIPEEAFALKEDGSPRKQYRLTISSQYPPALHLERVRKGQTRPSVSLNKFLAIIIITHSQQLTINPPLRTSASSSAQIISFTHFPIRRSTI